MSKSEVQPFVAFVLCSPKVMLLFLVCPAVPDLGFRLVTPNVVVLRTHDEDNTDDGNGDQNTISFPIIWLIVRTINVGRNNTSNLHKHVVDCRSDSPGSNSVCIPRGQSYIDRVTVWITDQQRTARVLDPFVLVVWQ